MDFVWYSAEGFLLNIHVVLSKKVLLKIWFFGKWIKNFSYFCSWFSVPKLSLSRQKTPTVSSFSYNFILLLIKDEKKWRMKEFNFLNFQNFLVFFSRINVATQTKTYLVALPKIRYQNCSHMSHTFSFYHNFFVFVFFCFVSDSFELWSITSTGIYLVNL